MDDLNPTHNVLTDEKNLLLGYTDFAQDAKYATKLIEQQIAKGTKRVYASDWCIFQDWCNPKQLDPLHATPEIIALFLASQFKAGFHPSTLSRRLAAIKFNFTRLGLESPTDKAIVRATLKGIRRDESAPPTREKKAATSEIITQRMLHHIPEHTLHGIRDRAILLIGFAGGFRRSELTALDFEDLTFQSEIGLDIKIRRSKTDQEGTGKIKSIINGKHHCPVAALKRWITSANITSGPLFRPITKKGKVKDSRLYGNNIYHLLKRCAFLSNLPFTDFSPHSLRAGFITSAAENGERMDKIMEVSLHKDPRSLVKYIRHVDRFKDHAGKKLL